ncbi:MAG TPA: hypothetical protein VL137_17665 [Polyangiaceae bacterium]|nr:hypothetical protein [Polyangiaceae bacterium]
MARPASAQEATAMGGTPAAAAPPAPKKPPYSLPWQLRPVVVANVVRSDTALAFYKSPAGQSGSTVASMLLASYKLTDSFAPMVRIGFVHNSPPAGKSGNTLTNPVLGGTYALKFDDFKVGLFLGIALPLGGGGGNTPDLPNRTAMAAGISARSAMDNAMFAMNYLTFFPGAGIAYVKDGVTVQAEATLLQLFRTRGDLVDVDSSRTNLTMGLHAGYFFIPELSAGVELRHQRWLSTPAPVKVNSALRDNTTVAIGPRAHFKLGENMWLRPGIALALPVDKPMTDAKYKIVQIDVPFVF